MIAWLVSMVFALGGAAAAGVRYWRVRNTLRFDLATLTSGLGRTACHARLESLLQVARQDGECWETAFLDDLLAARSEQERVAVANEHLADLEAELDWGQDIVRAAARIGLLGPLCAAFFVVAGRSPTWDDLAPLFAWSFVGALAPVWVERAAHKIVKSAKEGADAFVLRCVDPAACPPK